MLILEGRDTEKNKGQKSSVLTDLSMNTVLRYQFTDFIRHSCTGDIPTNSIQRVHTLAKVKQPPLLQMDK